MQGISGSLQLHVAVATAQGQIINQITRGISARKSGTENGAPGSPKIGGKKTIFKFMADLWTFGIGSPSPIVWHVIMQL